MDIFSRCLSKIIGFLGRPLKLLFIVFGVATVFSLYGLYLVNLVNYLLFDAFLFIPYISFIFVKYFTLALALIMGLIYIIKIFIGDYSNLKKLFNIGKGLLSILVIASIYSIYMDAFVFDPVLKVLFDALMYQFVSVSFLMGVYNMIIKEHDIDLI